MLIATWNVNSIKAHMDCAMAWFKEAKPDVVCLQETKCEDSAFPAFEFEAMGYSCALFGQKTYNGVAILSKFALENVTRGLPGDEADEQSRFISATVMAERPVTVASIYLPNGNPAPGPKFDYKLGFMGRLEAFAAAALATEEATVLLGDYNVIPAAADARKPEAWTGDALFLPASRAAFSTIKALGYVDAFRAMRPLAENAFTFWDYQAGAWQKNNGIRIDHALLSPQAADRLTNIRIDAHVRGWEKPSDHVPLVAELAT